MRRTYRAPGQSRGTLHSPLLTQQLVQIRPQTPERFADNLPPRPAAEQGRKNMTAIRGYVPATTDHTAVGVHSLDQFVLTVPDLASAQRFYGSFGLDVRED